MKLLAVDTASKSASAALYEDGRLRGEFYADAGLTHSVTLMPMVQSLLRACAADISEIGLFAAASGPGSFTGLRIGVAAVKGMAFANNAPCVGVSSLESLARNLDGLSGIACAVMDARRSQVYNALFELGKRSRRLTPDRAIQSDELAKELASLNEPVILVGDGAVMCYERFREALPNVRLAPGSRLMGRASSAALLAIEEYARGGAVSAAELIPRYLRLPQAQRELLEAQQKNGGV